MTVNSALTNALCEATSWQRTFGGEPAHPQKISPSLRCVWCSSLTPFASCWSTWRLAAGRPDVAASVEGSLVQTICAQRPQSLAAVFSGSLACGTGKSRCCRIKQRATARVAGAPPAGLYSSCLGRCACS